MSIESRIKQLELRKTSSEQHIHWMVPDVSGGYNAPNPQDCAACREADYKLHYIILFNMRPDKNQKELNHVRV